MSKIEDLEKELYVGQEDEELKKRKQHREYFPANSGETPLRWQSETTSQNIFQKKSCINRKTIMKIFGIMLAIAIILGGVFALFLYLGSRGKEVSISIFARSSIESGEIIAIPITLKNISRVALREAEVSVLLPETSLLIEGSQERPIPPRYSKKLDDFLPGEEKTIEVHARMFGHEGEEKKVEVTMLYRPDDLRARFSAKELQTLVIGRVPLAIAWDMPRLLSSGQEVLLNIQYTSSAKSSFGDIALRMTYPPGFNFISSDPSPDADQDIWKVGNLKPNDEGKIHIRGLISGIEGEVKAFRAELGVYNDLTKEWRSYSDSVREANIAVSPLSVQGFYDQTRENVHINPGDSLLFTVKYKNNTTYTIKNVTVRAFLSEDPLSQKERVIMLSSLEIEKGGVFDGPSHAVIWGPGNVSELREIQPGKEGSFAFRIKTKERPIMRGVTDANLRLVLHSMIEAAGVPEELAGTKITAEDSVMFKVKTKTFFSGRAVYRASPLPNSGPLPPRVNNKTTYTILWEIRNFTNSIVNADVVTTLPANVRWENIIFPKDAHITFDSASGEVHWRLAEIKAGIGVLRPTLVGAFQVFIKPSEADLGEAVNLTGESVFRGKDSFTEDAIEKKLPRFTTELRDDFLTSQRDWQVVK